MPLCGTGAATDTLGASDDLLKVPSEESVATVKLTVKLVSLENEVKDGTTKALAWTGNVCAARLLPLMVKV